MASTDRNRVRKTRSAPQPAKRARRTAAEEAKTPSRPLWIAGGAAAAVGVLLVGALIWSQSGPADDSSPVIAAPTAAISSTPTASATAVTLMRPTSGPDLPKAGPPHEPAAKEIERPVEAPAPQIQTQPQPLVAPPPAAVALLDDGLAAPVAPEAPASTVRPLPEFSTPEQQDEFVLHLKDMLYEGYRGRDGFASAEKHYQDARKLSDADPRLDYGFGLILWKNLRYDDALSRFDDAAAKSPDYWPAWQFSIRQRLARKDIDGALTRFLELARALRRAGNQPSDDHGRVECATWMGRLIAFLEEPETDARVDAETASRCDATVVDILAGDLLLLNAYRNGRSSLQTDYTEKLEAAEESLADLQARIETESAEELKRIGQEREKQKDQAEKVELTAEQWKDWIDERLAEHDKKLKELTDRHNELQFRLQQATATILQLGQEAAQFQQANRGNQRVSGTRSTFGFGQDHPDYVGAVVFNQLQTEHRVLEQQVTALRREGTRVMAARQADVARYQKATGKLVDQNDTLQKWKEVLASKEQSTRKRSTTSTPEARLLRRQAGALNTYFPFDADEEKQRILDSLPENSAAEP